MCISEGPVIGICGGTCVGKTTVGGMIAGGSRLGPSRLREGGCGGCPGAWSVSEGARAGGA